MAQHLTMKSAVKPAVLFLAAICLSSLALRAQEPCKPPDISLTPAQPNIFSAQQEEWLGDVLAQKVGYLRTTDDPAVTAYLAEIGDRLARFLSPNQPPNPIHYRYFVVDSASVDAFSIAGGRIYITRGMIAQLRSPDEAAAILAHEMGHIVTHQTAIDITFLLQRILGVTSVTDRQDIQKKLDELESNWRRDPSAIRRVIHESGQNQLQADQVGLFVFTSAGYSPEAFPAVFDRIAGTSGSTGGWLSDLLRTTTPEQLRLREMLKVVEAMPSSCIAHPAAGEAADFQSWRTAALDFTGWGKRAASLHDVLAQVKLEPLPSAQGTIQSIRFSPDGEYLLAQKGEEIFVFTREPFAFVFSIHAPDAWQPRFTVDSKSVAFVSTGSRVEVWDIASKKRVRLDEPKFNSPCTTAVLSPDAAVLACLRADGTLDLVRLPSGALIFEKDRLATPLGGKSARYSTLLPPAHMAFSADGRYFVGTGGRAYRAQAEGGTVAFDVTDPKEIRLPSPLKNRLANGFAFVSDDRLLAWNSVEPLRPSTVPINVPAAPAMLYQFPSGKVIGTLGMGWTPNLMAATHGDYVLAGPLIDYSQHQQRPPKHELGIIDLNSRVVRPLEYTAADVYDDVYAHETLDGSLALYDVGTGNQKASVVFPPTEGEGSYGQVSASRDLKWLAASAGAVWDMSSGKMFYHMRPFQSGRFDGESAFYATFPPYRETPRTLVRLDLIQRSVTPIREVEASVSKVEPSHTVEYGPYLLTLTPHETNVAHALFSPCHWKYPDFDPLDCDVTVEVRDASSNRLLWSRRFPKESPRLHVDPDAGLIMLRWTASEAAFADEIKDHPELGSAWTMAGQNPGTTLLEILNLADGSLRRAMLLNGGVINDVRTAGTHLLVLHSGYMEVFSLATGAKEGDVPGWLRAVPASGDILSVREDSENDVEIYSLGSRTKIDDFTFPANVNFQQFSPDGKRLLVLTADQTAYFLDTFGHHHP